MSIIVISLLGETVIKLFSQKAPNSIAVDSELLDSSYLKYLVRKERSICKFRTTLEGNLLHLYIMQMQKSILTDLFFISIPEDILTNINVILTRKM